MGSCLFDYEAQLIRAALPQVAHHKHHRGPSESTASSRHGSTSAPTSTSTTRSSVSEAEYRVGSKGTAMPTSATPQLPVSRHQREANTPKNTLAAKSNTSSNNSLHEQYKAASLGDAMVPTDEIQEWAHQVHIRQRRDYPWCIHCCPRKMEPLQIPSEKAMKRVRIQEPTHAYE